MTSRSCRMIRFLRCLGACLFVNKRSINGRCSSRRGAFIFQSCKTNKHGSPLSSRQTCLTARRLRCGSVAALSFVTVRLLCCRLSARKTRIAYLARCLPSCDSLRTALKQRRPIVPHLSSRAVAFCVKRTFILDAAALRVAIIFACMLRHSIQAHHGRLKHTRGANLAWRTPARACLHFIRQASSERYAMWRVSQD